MVETEFSQNGDNNQNVDWTDDAGTTGRTICVVKKIINPAVYVESAIYDMAPFRPSPLCMAGDDDGITVRSIRVVKKCVCLTDEENCPCHPFEPKKELQADQKSAISTIDTKISLRSESECFLQKTTDEINYDFNSLTQRSNLSFSNNRAERNGEAEKNFRVWLGKKIKERREKEQEKIKMQEQQELERQKRIDQERENFKRWLAHKKKEEEERKRMIEQRQEQEKLILEMREKRTVENQLKYQLWLRKKEEAELCRKIKEQVKILKTEEDKQKRQEENQKAYQVWLKSSKYKPKPLPLNRGMETLRSSASVTYVNPTPWVPNIDKAKPNSQ